MRYLFTSNPLISNPKTEPESSQIILVAQYYIDSNPVRAKEIRHCLHKNVGLFDKIVLLNERQYSPEEMGFTREQMPSNIVQSIIGKRFQYEDAFKYARTLEENAYIVIANSDIFFDETLFNIRNSDLSEHKKCMAQLRYEYSPDHPPKLFGPRYDSQDAWIFHTNHLPPFPINIGLGIPGCDNKLVYLLHCAGFDVINHPEAVRTFHYHTSQVRRYTAKDALPDPYACVIPYGVETRSDSLGIKSAYKNEISFDDDKILYEYLLRKMSSGEKFVIPCCVSTLSLSVFQNCDLFGGWERWGKMYPSIGPMQEHIHQQLGKKMISASVFDIFHYIHHETPWTHALRGKRLLIISPFAETMKNQVAIRENIYGRELFPDCTFLFLVPDPHQIKRLSGQYDIALVSCGGGYTMQNIYDTGGSAIYVGDVLQMYFGILGNQWLKERPDMVRAYLNKYWTRQK